MLALGIARTEQMVTVKEAPPLLDTTTATVSSEVTSEQFVALPMLGRNFQSLLAILPGVAYVAPPNGYNFSVSGTGLNPSVYGQRNRDNDYTIDGVPNNEIDYNAIPTNPPPEAIAEMKVSTGSDIGAYGGSAGATISLVTKSGTNQYHGNAWEFLQNNALNARSFFIPNVGAYRWNQFGGTFGGPLILPHLRRDRAWYVYGWYEGVRIHSASNYTGLVPTAAELQGDFYRLRLRWCSKSATRAPMVSNCPGKSSTTQPLSPGLPPSPPGRGGPISQHILRMGITNSVPITTG